MPSMSSLSSNQAQSEAFEFIFLGTGTSSSVPHVDCLTAPPEREPCPTCLSTLEPEGWKNRRRNTCGLVRTNDKNGNSVTIVIDAGKTFQAGAVEWFPKFGLRKIDALLITHAHADAMNGLDDLRGWTLRGAVQKHIDIYVSHHTFSEVERSFPYLVSKKFASGGGDVPDLVWHIIEDGVPFEVGTTGIMVTPFNVEHGRIFEDPPPVLSGYATPVHSNSGTASPSKSASVSPKSTSPKELLVAKPLPNVVVPDVNSDKDKIVNANAKGTVTAVVRPYYCFGFRFGKELVYISDVSTIPASAWPHILPGRSLSAIESDKNHTNGGSNGNLNGTSNGNAHNSDHENGSDASHSPHSRLPLLVLDCLRPEPHTSHFGIIQAVEHARKIGAHRTLLTGFSHEVSHDEWERILLLAEGAVPSEKEKEQERKIVRHAMKLVEKGTPVCIRPAHDGMRVRVKNGETILEA